jgi:hypothetical protein
MDSIIITRQSGGKYPECGGAIVQSRRAKRRSIRLRRAAGLTEPFHVFWIGAQVGRTIETSENPTFGEHVVERLMRSDFVVWIDCRQSVPMQHCGSHIEKCIEQLAPMSSHSIGQTCQALPLFDSQINLRGVNGHINILYSDAISRSKPAWNSRPCTHAGRESQTSGGLKNPVKNAWHKSDTNGAMSVPSDRSMSTMFDEPLTLKNEWSPRVSSTSTLFFKKRKNRFESYRGSFLFTSEIARPAGLHRRRGESRRGVVDLRGQVQRRVLIGEFRPTDFRRGISGHWLKTL